MPKTRRGLLASRLYQPAARLVARFGRREAAHSNTYYPQHHTCQIPTLSSLFYLFFGPKTEGFFVEIGAYDGLFVSNTWGLAQKGWNGILVEPLPRLASTCRRNYKDFPGIEVIQLAIASKNGELMLHVAGTLTTANTEVFAEYSQVDWAKDQLSGEYVKVPTVTLDNLLLSRSVQPGFELLVVDVEGFETEVFAGFDLDKWKPKMLIVELADTHPDLSATQVQDARLGSRIASAGYVIVYKDSINTVFVCKELWNTVFSAV